MVVMGFEPMISQILSLEPLTTRSKQPYYLYKYFSINKTWKKNHTYNFLKKNYFWNRNCPKIKNRKRRIVVEVAFGMSYIHSRGIIHHDEWYFWGQNNQFLTRSCWWSFWLWKYYDRGNWDTYLFVAWSSGWRIWWKNRCLFILRCFVCINRTTFTKTRHQIWLTNAYLLKHKKVHHLKKF